MKRISCAVLAVLSLLTISAAWSQDAELRDPILPNKEMVQALPRPSGFDRNRRMSLSDETRKRAGPALSSVVQAAGDGTLVDSVAIRPELLKAAPLPGPRGEIGALGDSISEAGARLLTIDGKSYEMAIVSQAFDEKIPARHVTMQVLNAADSYARFSVMGDQIVGTVQTPQVTYRIVPFQPGIQLVYRLNPVDDLRTAKYGRVTAADAATPVNALERRHVQLEQIADIQPELAMSSESGGSLLIRGGHLGVFPQRRPTSQDVIQVLHRLAPLSSTPAVVDVVIKQVFERSNGREIQFEQVIGRIPVWSANHIRVARDGSITEVDIQLVDPERAPAAPLMSQGQALKHATDALEDKFKLAFPALEPATDAKLYYHIVPLQAELAPKYEFRFDLDSKGIWHVLVDGRTGESEVFDPSQSEYGYRVCRDNSATQGPLTCTAPGAQTIHSKVYGSTRNTCPFHDGHGNNLCLSVEPKAGQVGLFSANVATSVIEQTNPSVCCDRLGGADHTIDLVYQTSGWFLPGGRYDPVTESLLTPQGDVSFQSIEAVL